MIKTINLTGSEVKVTELGGDNTEIFNNGSGVIYASKLPNITVGGDEVIAIPAGAIDGLYGTHGTVYLLGSGCVELRGVDHKIANVRGATVINENGGVTEADVEKKCDAILDDAKSYADEKDDEMLETAKEYVNSLNAELAGYIGYTDNDIYGLEVDFENGVFKGVEIFNIGVDTATTVREIADMVCRRLGLENVEYKFTGGNVGWKGDVPAFQYDLSKIYATGWRAKHNSNESVRATLDSLEL